MSDQDILQAFTTYVNDRVLSDSLDEYSAPVARMTITVLRNTAGGYNTWVKARFKPKPTQTLEADDSNAYQEVDKE